MSKYLLMALGGAVAIGLALPVQADEPPPGGYDPISLDRASPSVVGFGNTPGDIYGEAFGPILSGWDVGGPGPILHVPEGFYGLLPGDNNDGHSNGEVNPLAQVVIYFSGDDLSIGAPGTDYDHQAVRAQAAGDRFVVNGFVPGPAPVFAAGVPAPVAGPVLPGPTNLLSANQHRYNEIPSILPAAFNGYLPPAGATVMDDMDALELTAFDVTGDLIHDTPIYFSLDAFSPSLPGSAADILVSPPGLPLFVPFAPAASLGLVFADDVDALAVWDVDGSLSATPGDFAIFSLAPGSPSLGGGLFSPADIFVTDFSGVNSLYVTAASLGMAFTDNVDAIDVELWFGPQSIEIFDEVPEPASLALLGIGVLTIMRRRSAA